MLVELSSADIERKLWGQQLAVAAGQLRAAEPAHGLGEITHVGLAARGGAGRLFVVEIWHRLDRRGSPRSGPAAPQLSPTLRWHEIRGAYRVTAGARVSGPTPREDVRAWLPVTGLRSDEGATKRFFSRTIRIPAGRDSVTASAKVKTSRRLTNFVAELLPLEGAVSLNMLIRVPTRIPGVD